MAKPRTRPEPGISRIDQPARRTYGWFVRVSAHGQLLSRFFPDRSHGGKLKAFNAARKHRDLIRAALVGKIAPKAPPESVKRVSGKDAGWVVTLGERCNRFTDVKYGGPTAAKAAAHRYRAAVLVHEDA
jgi:hypothetical protein